MWMPRQSGSQRGVPALEKGCHDNEPWLGVYDKVGLAAWHYAAKSRGTSAVKWLLERGAEAVMGMGVLLLTLRSIGHVKVAGFLRGIMRKSGSRY